jgi:hypothetical protein
VDDQNVVGFRLAKIENKLSVIGPSSVIRGEQNEWQVSGGEESTLNGDNEAGCGRRWRLVPNGENI